jgi:hypothetical protein
MVGIVPSGPLTMTSSSLAGGSKRNCNSSTGDRTVEPAAGLELARIDCRAAEADEAGTAES